MSLIVYGASGVLLVRVLAAVLPALVLLGYIYHRDQVEKEPSGLLLSLFLLGMISALCAGVVERFLRILLERLVSPGTVLHTVLLAFAGVAMVEEGVKFWVLKHRTWNHPAFDYRFDAIVYAVFVSLGFAVYENVLYVCGTGLSTAALRAVTAIPAHMSFSVFCGVFYGRAKRCAVLGRESLVRWNLQMAYVIAGVFHGFYDACAMVGTRLAMAFFVVFMVVMFVSVFRVVRIESYLDQPL